MARVTRSDLGGTLRGQSCAVGISNSVAAPGGAETMLRAADDCPLQTER